MASTKISKTSEKLLEQYVEFRNEHEAMPESEEHLSGFTWAKADFFALVLSKRKLSRMR